MKLGKLKALPLALLLTSSASAGSLEERIQSQAAALARMFQDGKAVAYAPTNFNPNIGLYPSENSIRLDMRQLRQEGFEGIVTYDCVNTLQHVARIAKEEGFTFAIPSIWCPTDNSAIQIAISQAQYADGYVINNEGLPYGYSYCAYDTTSLKQAMEYVRQQTGKPVTTTEQADDYLSGSLAGFLLRNSDWVFPNVHPYWSGYTDPAQAVNFTVSKFNELAAVAALYGKEVVVKEEGLPSAGCANCSEQNQLQYYQSLVEQPITFYFFEAFDQYWKNWAPVEPHWGLNTSARLPKLVGQWLISVPIQPVTWGRIKYAYKE